MQQETARLITYAAVGIGVLLVYLALNLIFLQLGLTAGTANVMAFVLAVCVQYAGQTLFTFGGQLNDKSQALRFIVMITLGWSASQAIVLVCAKQPNLSPSVGPALAALWLPVQNYFFLRFWVYAKAIGGQKT